jgi:hypothetical protein
MTILLLLLGDKIVWKLAHEAKTTSRVIKLTQSGISTHLPRGKKVSRNKPGAMELDLVYQLARPYKPAS